MECDDKQNEPFYTFLILYFCQYLENLDLSPFSGILKACKQSFVVDVLVSFRGEFMEFSF